MREHKTVFRVLAWMQNDIDVQRLTFEAYMKNELVKARPLAHVKIGLKNLAHLSGQVRPDYS